MGEDNFITFEDYKKKVLKPPRPVTDLTNDEILEEMDKVVKADKEGRKKVDG